MQKGALVPFCAFYLFSKSNRKGLIFMKRFFALFLCAVMMLSLISCGEFAYEWEVDTHDEFVKNIEKYNSINDGFVDTFISFDLDDNTEITKRLYGFHTMVSSKNVSDIYDINDKFINISLVFYMKGNTNIYSNNDHAYKIRCEYKSVKYNFSEDDQIKIQPSKESGCVFSYLDLYYQESLSSGYRYSKDEVYKSFYHYEILVNDEDFGCIHISCIEEPSEEKLNEIIDMLYDSLVIINT